MMRQKNLFEPMACDAAAEGALPEGKEPVSARPVVEDGRPAVEDGQDPATIAAGWPEEADERCVRLDAAAVLQATPRSFALTVRGVSMVGAGIHDGDVVVGEFTPEARPGAVVVALIDGESTLKRFVIHQGRPHLASENPACPDLTPLSELVIQGVVRCVVKKVK